MNHFDSRLHESSVSRTFSGFAPQSKTSRKFASNLEIDLGKSRRAGKWSAGHCPAGWGETRFLMPSNPRRSGFCRDLVKELAALNRVAATNAVRILGFGF